jgi:hypothetical protein
MVTSSVRSAFTPGGNEATQRMAVSTEILDWLVAGEPTRPPFWLNVSTFLSGDTLDMSSG